MYSVLLIIMTGTEGKEDHLGNGSILQEKIHSYMFTSWSWLCIDFPKNN